MKKKIWIAAAVSLFFFLSACSVTDIIDILEILVINPTPLSGSSEIVRDPVLEWDVDTNVEEQILSYTVYLDQSPNPVTLIGNTTNKTFIVNGLDYSTTYYWKIVVHHNSGVNVTGPVWQFTTEEEPVIQGQLRGLTLGVTDYGGGDDLEYTDDDADSIKVVFENLMNPYTIQKKTGTVTKTQIINWLSAYEADSTAGDVFLFQFSGHGFYSGGQSRMYLSDGSNISVLELRAALSAINGTKIVLIDACQSGGFTNLSSERNLTRSEKIKQTERFNQGIIQAFSENNQFRGNYLTTYEYYVLTGSAISEYSNEDNYLKHGYFTFFFNDGLGDVGVSNRNDPFDYTYDADGYGPGGVLDGEVTFRELYHYSKDKVQNYINTYFPGDVQTIQGNHITEDFVIGVY